MSRSIWMGPGFGWIDPLPLNLETFARDLRLHEALTNALFAVWIEDQFRTGRLPGNQENSMFKFSLGASVVLITSLAAAHTEANERDSTVVRDADNAAARAREEVLRASGRSDLIDRRAEGTDRASAWTGVKLAAFTPIEAGEVIGRAEYVGALNSYLVRYRAGDGRQVEVWQDERAIAWDPRVSENARHFAVRGDDGDAA